MTIAAVRPVAPSHRSRRVRRRDLILLCSVALALLAGLIYPLQASAASVAEFPVGAGTSPRFITAGPDGNMWFTEEVGPGIGRITPSGSITEFSLPPNKFPNEIAAGPDGNVWFTEEHAIGFITPQGTITEFPYFGFPYWLTAGPDGNMWVATGIGLARITKTGTITEFPTFGFSPWSITLGPDGNFWVTEFVGTRIGRMTPSGTFTAFSVPSGRLVTAITTGEDGNLWFNELNGIGRSTTSGAITEYPGEFRFSNITRGPCHAIWARGGPIGGIYQVAADGGLTKHDAFPSGFQGIAAGPEGNLWTTLPHAIGRFEPPGCGGGTVTTTSTSLSGGGQSGTSITVPEGTAVTDQATLSGENAATATGKMSYAVYSDKECKSLVASAGEVEVTGGNVPPSSAQTLPPGPYYWTASYSGDGSNQPSSSKCGAETLTVASGPATAPTNTVPPAISGTAQLGQTLSCSRGSWTGNPPPSFTYQWLRDGSGITSATGSSYLVQAADEGHTLACAVTASNSAGQQTATSPGVAIPASSSGGGGGAGSTGSNPLSSTTAPGAGVLAFRSAAAAVATPILGQTANLQVISGVVLIELPGTSSFIPLSSVTSVPVGTIIDATNGTVQLTSAADAHGHTQTGLFYGGLFRVTQITVRLPGGKTVVVTVLTLVGPLPSGCKAKRAAHRADVAAKHAHSTARRLWADAKGNFRTVGRYASATVRGTKWLTEDTCAGTLIRVARGVVSVEDIPHRRTRLLRAPRSFLSHPGRGG